MRKIFKPALLLTLSLASLAACTDAGAAGIDSSGAISVVSREDGSGTRGAFIELFGVQVKEGDVTKDMTTDDAIIADKTDVMMTQVANDPLAVGYLSLGSLNDTVKALNIDGVKASVENVKNGSYKVQRPFNIATKGEVSNLAQDFINYIMSAEGQAIVTANGYIAVDENTAAFSPSGADGKLTIAGSSSVTPVMEKLQEAYNTINPGANIEIQTTDSSAGMTSTMNGSCEIGMASRELKESELAELESLTIAFDGIVVIVNNSNAASNVTGEQVRKIYTGEITEWAGIQ